MKRSGLPKTVRSALRPALIGLGALIAAHGVGAPAAEIGYLGLYGSWEAREYADPDDGTRQCAARAIHPQLVDGDVLWVFNTGARDRQPRGYLAVDRRLAGDAAAAWIDTDADDRFDLVRGNDLHLYNSPGDADALFAALVRGYAARVVLERTDGRRTEIPVSLIGFTRATDVLRAACGF